MRPLDAKYKMKYCEDRMEEEERIRFEKGYKLDEEIKRFKRAIEQLKDYDNYFISIQYVPWKKHTPINTFEEDGMNDIFIGCMENHIADLQKQFDEL